ncbi:MAG: biotin--[acetyl-CoA-carboxylase] ligase [Pontiellaceae bacterium]|nr:biotin--[acetyl-CoA-carboxylase] ligase [Pontiellaceae bacterium]MBN2783813.1 biotin--[acetyl-CoA-carboxylase] ligase [Pontiellaceae bacterium]
MQFTIEWQDRLGSTNSTMRERISLGEKAENGWILATREQTCGRGRQQRKWVSMPDTNLCFSLFLKTHAPLIQIPSLTMAVALAVNDLLNYYQIHSAPKWPNDVLVGPRKICGILSERTDCANTTGIIIGIGLNVNMSKEDAEAIDRPATSILMESGIAHPPASILDALLPQIEFWINEWEKGGFTAIRDIWTEKAGPVGKAISVHDGDVRKSGTLAGFGEHGELLMKTRDGIETIWSGDVS